MTTTTPVPPKDPRGDNATRRALAFALITVVLALALVAVAVPQAMLVLERVLPLATLILGYYFGQTAQAR